MAIPAMGRLDGRGPGPSGRDRALARGSIAASLATRTDNRSVQTCPSCGTDVPADARFCATCGAPLASATDARSGAGAGAGEERRLVTVLFADVTGSTELGEQLDAERVRATLERYFAAMSTVIASWNGTVEKYIGDAIMAVFGIPTAHEDDAQRACSAALEMLERLETLNAELKDRLGVTVQIRIGLNSGEVVTPARDGRRGAGRRHLVSGDVVNVASRLQGAAEPGDVLVGPRTYLAARHAYDFDDETQLELKGKSAPVAARRLLRALPELQRRGVPGLEAPMIGRDRELDLLSGLLDEAIEVDRPRLVTIYGAAGIGKSRLLRELIARVDGHQPPITVLRGRCLAAGQRVTFCGARGVAAQRDRHLARGQGGNRPASASARASARSSRRSACRRTSWPRRSTPWR